MFFHKKNHDTVPTTATTSELPPARWKQLVTIGVAGLTLVACSAKEQAGIQPATSSETSTTLQSSTAASAPAIDTYVAPTVSSETAAPDVAPETTTHDTTPVSQGLMVLTESSPAPTTSPELSSQSSTTSTETTPSTAAPSTSEHTSTPEVTITALTRGSGDEILSNRIHNAGSYNLFSPAEKAVFDTAAKATYAEFLKLAPTDQATYANAVVRDSYVNFNGDALGASNTNFDKKYILDHVWPDGMNAAPSKIESNPSAPADYASILIADALFEASHDSGETAAKIITGLFAGTEDQGAINLRNSLLEIVVGLSEGKPVIPIIDQQYLDRNIVAKYAMLDNRFVTDSKLDGDVYSLTLNNPEAQNPTIHLVLKAGEYLVDGSPRPYWIIQSTSN